MKSTTKPQPFAHLPILGPRIAHNCTRLRRAADELTQAALANRAGTTQATVSKAERSGAISLEMIEHLAGAMGVDPIEFFRKVRP